MTREGWIPCGVCDTECPSGFLTETDYWGEDALLCAACAGALEQLQTMRADRIDRHVMTAAHMRMQARIKKTDDDAPTVDPVRTLVGQYFALKP